MNDSTNLPADHEPLGPDQTGVLLVNLGTPDSLDLADIRRYLREFLSDRRVIDYSPIIWQPILRGIILNTRPRKTREAYKKIWREDSDESPLRYFTRQQAKKLSDRLGNPKVQVNWAMNYGNPGIGYVLEQLLERGCRRILVLPLYPQYSATTTASVYDRLFAAIQARQWQPAIRTFDTWHDDVAYINASVSHLTDELRKLPALPEKLILSFHGLPERYLIKGDPYYCFCQKSGRLITDGLKDLDLDVLVTFQSKFGPEKWLQPATADTIAQLAEEGTRTVAVYSPGFVSDCVETLEEIGVKGKALFQSRGGTDLFQIPCLNDSEPCITMLEEIVSRELSGWI